MTERLRKKKSLNDIFAMEIFRFIVFGWTGIYFQWKISKYFFVASMSFITLPFTLFKKKFLAAYNNVYRVPYPNL